MQSDESYSEQYKVKKAKKPKVKKAIAKEKFPKGKKSEKGKPKGLGQTTIIEPNIWATNKIIIEFVTFLIESGRHINLHLAGTTHIAQSDQKQQKLDLMRQQQQQIKDQKPLYDFLEDFSKRYLKLNCVTRCVIFFFRNNNEAKPKYRNFYPLETGDWTQMLKKFYFLLDEKFYEELQFILYYLERRFAPLDIADMLIEKAQNLSESPQILQNLFVQLILEREINFQTLKSYQKEDLEILFQNSINNKKTRIVKFIKTIQDIFNKSGYSQYDGDHEMRQIPSEISQNNCENDDPFYAFDD